jgi:nucleoside 2-deoxyribosyltransferase
MKHKIYLAGGWSDWRNKVASNIINCEFLDPSVCLDNQTGDNLPDWFEIETEMIRNCDAVICWITKDNQSGFGATFEMGMAYALNKPYILILEKSHTLYQWGMQIKGADYCCSTLKESLSWIKANKWVNDPFTPKAMNGLETRLRP